MTVHELFRTAERLEQRIDAASGAARLALQPQLRAVLHQIEAEGRQVPLHLRRLEASLGDEAVEALFDNMPV